MNKEVINLCQHALFILRTHANNVTNNGDIINKEMIPISDEIKSAMWGLVDAVEKEQKGTTA